MSYWTLLPRKLAKNVVQLIADNGCSYVLADKKLTLKMQHMFWTPCDAHCIDLMLEDKENTPRFHKVIQKGISVLGYMYNHIFALNLMKKITQNFELVRNGVTRFDTILLTLQRLHKLKTKLTERSTCEYLVSSKYSRDPKGKRATCIIFIPSF